MRTRAGQQRGWTAEEAAEVAEVAAAREDAEIEAAATGEATRRGVGPPFSTKLTHPRRKTTSLKELLLVFFVLCIKSIKAYKKSVVFFSVL